MSSAHFSFDLRDAKFTLFEQLRIHEQLAELPRYRDFDRETYEATMEEAERVARELLAPLNGPGDREGCHLDEHGQLRTPSGYRDAWKTFSEGGWVGPRADPAVGGAGLPAPIGALLTECFSGACVAFVMYQGLTAAAARVIGGHGPKWLAEPVAQRMFSGQWGGTMCLTEADAGSSVGDNRAKALPTDRAGVYRIEGEKIFISGGDSDLTENICHLVLARTPGAPSGTKGLSLFLVPKYRFDESFECGESNGVEVLKIEAKMGIKGSATCVLGFGLEQPCSGWLLGDECEGISLMFEMMNEARIGVGLQGLAAGAAAYRYSLHYANERLQGTRLEEIKNPEAERVAIVRHPDVRRMLMHQKVLVETMRAMAYRVALDFELSEHLEDSERKEALAERVDLLVPVLKALCTDLGFEVAVMGVQIFGGYGYISDFPIEQLVRDAKIQSIYEGTNGIQALDLLGRKMRRRNGALFMAWMQECRASIEAGRSEGFEAAAEALERAIQSLGAAAMQIAGIASQGKVGGAMVHATPFLRAFGLMHLGIEALEQARVARKKIAAQGEDDHLHGKLKNLEFFVAHFLPLVVAESKAIRSGDESCLDERLFSV